MASGRHKLAQTSGLEQARYGRRAAAASTHYDVLEVALDASREEIRQSYRRMILLHHPDKRTMAGDAGSSGVATPEALNVAYETLFDPEKRAAYDAELQAKSGKLYDTLRKDSQVLKLYWQLSILRRSLNKPCRTFSRLPT